jgi:hypothetical protein
MLRRLIVGLLILSLAAPIPAHAGMIATDSAVRQTIAEALERPDVQAQLRAYGVSAGDVKARVAAMSDEEAAELAARIESLPAGGIGIVGAIVLIFLVLLITDILGFTKVFPFTRPIK